VIISFRIK